MGNISEIQWTDATWNVARGCKKVDADCKYCYMYRQSLNNTRYKADQVTKTKTVFTLPLHYKETKSSCWSGNPLIFTSSLTDFFIEEIDDYRHEAWDIIRKCPHLTFQILTKRPERIAQCLPADWGDGWDNVWLGTSIGSMDGIDPCNLTWIETVISDAKSLDIPVFVKQVGTYLAKELDMTTRHGGNFDEFPASIKFREFPKPILS